MRLRVLTLNLQKLLSQPNLSIHRSCCSVSASVNSKLNVKPKEEFKTKLATGPGFQDFIKDASRGNKPTSRQESDHHHSYLSEDTTHGNSRKGNVNVIVSASASQG